VCKKKLKKIQKIGEQENEQRENGEGEGKGRLRWEVVVC